MQSTTQRINNPTAIVKRTPSKITVYYVSFHRDQVRNKLDDVTLCKDGVDELSLVDVDALASTDAAGAARTAAVGGAALARAAHVSTAVLQTPYTHERLVRERQPFLIA